MSDIDEVKSRLNIIEAIGARVALKKAGRNFKGLCPFHSEKTPSFMVSPERNAWHCFGCARGGSVIDFVMEYEHVDFIEALETLAEKAGVKLMRRAPDSPEAKLKQQLLEINHLTSEFYHYLLTKHKLGEKARNYLKTRGVSEKLIKTFVLGYSPNSWDATLKFLRKKGYSEELIEKAGLIIKSQNSMTKFQQKYYDRFRGRLMFTLKDHRGNVVGFSGRALDPAIKEAKYINSPETPVYSKSRVLYGLEITKEEISHSRKAVLMEGELDVISSFAAGITNAIAIKGSALTEGHIALLKRFAQELIFCLDSDVAGDAASRRGIELADAAGFEMKVVKLRSGKDPDEVARSAPAKLIRAIAEAIPIYDYFIDSSLSRFDAKDAYGKKQIAAEVLPWLAKIENAIVQEHYLKTLAGKLAISETVLTDQLHIYLAKLEKGNLSVKPSEGKPAGLPRAEKLELYTLALLLAGETLELWEELKENLALADFNYTPVEQILKRLENYLPKTAKFLVRDFADSLPPELTRVVDQACLWDLGDLTSDREAFAKEWTRALRELRIVILRRQIEAISQNLAQSGQDQADDKQRLKLHELTVRLKTLENPSPT